MLQIKDIRKQYITGNLVQQALDGVSLNFRENEFVSILGPSGSGKTTLLNIIGGLDRYDDGDLIINGISTKKYKDRDWDSYRNHTIGFVFQSYNLIPHQSVLANVELALTISGISKAERRERAKKALEEVGLGDQIHKKPNQMSGGQMQRVAIARALVNNPKVLLADEPTGALDTETSVQVMELLKEVAKDRLVIMVTHNPELAEEYATRIVRLRDGKITDDSNPYLVEEASEETLRHENMGKSSMSYLTALSLSFNNLKTKKARTLLTAFAGSIGIIGIALILSLSNGVNNYITDIQKSTMTSYPITIEAQALDFSSIIEISPGHTEEMDIEHEKDAVYMNSMDLELASTVTTSLTQNNLTEFKKYLDDEDSEIHEYVGDNGILYTYDTKFGVYTTDPEGEFVNTDGSTLQEAKQSAASSMLSGIGSSMGGNSDGSAMSSMVSGASDNFEELLPDSDGTGVSNAIKDNYDLLYGEWPEAYDEVVLVLNKNNEIAATTIYELGILPSSEYKELMEQLEDGEKLETQLQQWSYEDICDKQFYLIPACDMYVENENGTFDCIADDEEALGERFEDAIKLKVTGVIRPDEDLDNLFINAPFGYTRELTDYLIQYTEESAVVKAQEENADINVINGMSFEPKDDAAKISDVKIYLSGLGVSDKAKLCKEMLVASAAEGSGSGTDAAMMANMGSMGETELAAMMDQYLLNPEDEVMLAIYDAYISTGSYDDNMSSFGVVSLDAPSSINIYADSFEDKDEISKCIDVYNNGAREENQISYTDYVGLLMSSVTTIIDVISYVLIAFVAVSLVVSSIMIGIITYISVLERTKEIGILRALGASRKNISQVFNAETFIIGLCAGAMGVGISCLLLIPGNMLIHSVAGTTEVNASLPAVSAAILVILSVLLTLIGGLIPSKKAAKKDPVTALRTE
ncbi:MAG: ABC transporter ATP-binding protein/permease [Schaedlerella sp.]|nr:ABC transporter ATP-binding protein/permease [Lachnospiraceae bacterium]MDY4203552.1 ABC transporter ATP-binding protein/permease [Schaedlerella sp.]